MWFEGAEKKFEIVTTKGPNLRALGDVFWAQVVDLASAKILSKIENEQMMAYLLSESSLFVWDNRVTMITCGRTQLVRALGFLLEKLTPDAVDLLTYQRKNEYYPHRQETDFFKDVEILKSQFPGLAFRFGSPDEHHLFLFHGEKPFRPQGVDATLEILMYNLKGPARALFDGDRSRDELRRLTQLDEIFPDFQIDDFAFSPRGYSVNAIRGGDYFTIHVTPEENSSYVSFETNVKLGLKAVTVIRKVIDLFQPDAFDLIYFHPEKELKAFDLSPYSARNHVRQNIRCGYEVGFSTYYLNTVEAQTAIPLEVEP